MSAWIAGYQQSHPKIGVNYRAVGSGGGVEEFKKGWIEFAASDAPLSDDQLKEISPTVQLPVTAGPVCFVYNLPGLERPLRLSPNSVAGLFLGTIINWQDPVIVRDNPGVKLPRTAVIVVHRSDGSGTTNILTEYLSKISQDWSFRAGHGLSVIWPVGLGADGSKGVLSLVKQSPGTIGFLELNYAKENGVPVAAVQNRGGTFVDPTPQSTAAAIDASEAELAKDVRNPIVDPPASAKSAYPVAGLTFLLMPKDRPNKDEQAVVRDFVAYAVSGGQDLAERLSYAKLPTSLQQQAQASLKQLTANGQPLN
jgi:phosphate transport system substrate-binding protein